MITVKTWWTLAGVFVKGFSFPNKQDQQMAYTDRSSSFLPVVDTILASFTPASTNRKFEAVLFSEPLEVLSQEVGVELGQ
jgi:hypothetical protein